VPGLQPPDYPNQRAANEAETLIWDFAFAFLVRPLRPLLLRQPCSLCILELAADG
jgi:hypothetical protein